MNDRQAFLASRCGKLGPSDFAVILGLVGSRAALYEKKRKEIETGIADESEQSWPMERGHLLEQGILARAAKQIGAVLVPGETLTVPEHPWLVCHTDASFQQGGLLVPADAKAPMRWSMPKWDDTAPDYYVPQISTYAWIMGAPFGYLCADTAEDEIVVHKIQRDDKLVERCLIEGAAFMLAVELGEPISDLPQTEKTERKAAIQATGQLLTLTQQWMEDKNRLKLAEAAEADTKRQLMDLLPPDAERIAIEDSEVVKIVQKLNPRTDWDRLRQENPGLLERYALQPTISTYPQLSRRKMGPSQAPSKKS